MNISPVKTGAVAGLLLGLFGPTALFWVELIRRIAWAAGGGRGETADWGEPLFYIVLIGIPGGIAGVFIGVILAIVVFKIIELLNANYIDGEGFLGPFDSLYSFRTGKLV